MTQVWLEMGRLNEEVEDLGMLQDLGAGEWKKTGASFFLFGHCSVISTNCTLFLWYLIDPGKGDKFACTGRLRFKD